MISLIKAAVALGWPMLLAGILAATRRGGWSLLALLIAAYVGGLVFGAIQPTDPLYLLSWTGLGHSALLLVLWTVYAALARVAGGARIPGPALLGAVLSGAILGEIAAAALVAANAEDRRSAARLALAASAGGLLGRLGDPVMLLVAAERPSVTLAVAPLALLCTLVLLPGGALSLPTGRWSVTVVGGLTAAGAVLLGTHAWIALIAGSIGLAVLSGPARVRSAPWHLPVYAAVICGLVTFAAAGGVPELAAEGIEFLQRWMGESLKPALALVAALLAMLLDSTGAALMADAVLDRAMSLSTSGVPAAIAAGAAIGGIGPLVIVGAVRAGLWRLLVQVGIVALWAGFFL